MPTKFNKNEKNIILILALSFFYFCSPKTEKVEKIIENGVEVVLNHLEPYKIKGEPRTLNLEEEFSIDLAGEDIVKLGLADIFSFDVDLEGNIYVLNWKPSENFIYKFDREGNFLTSFGRKGQGPGELQYGVYIGVDNQGNIEVSDAPNKKSVLFGKEGRLIKETPFLEKTWAMYPLGKGKYLSYWRKYTAPTADYFEDFFSLYDSELKEIRILDSCKWPNPRKHGLRGSRMNRVFNWKKSKENIYIGNEDRGYEILKYDLEGRLLKKIRKEYKPVKVQIPEGTKKRIRDERQGINVFFPDYWTPFGSFFPDDEGRLYVQTYEQGDNPKEYVYDIFNPEGIFIARKSLNIKPSEDIEGDAVAKKGRLYCVQETERGFKELVVYRMNWTK